MKKWLDDYPQETLGLLIGVIIAFCFLGLGFLKTVFVIAIAFCGGVIGHYWPKLQELRNK